MKNKINIIAFSFTRGGAAIAAQKFARLAQNFSEVTCYAAEPSVVDGLKVINPGKREYYIHLCKRVVSLLLLRLMKDENPIKHSLNLFSSNNAIRGLPEQGDSNIILHLHWVNNDTLSLFKLKDLPKFTIITLHDEWLFCGAEHCYPVKELEKKFVSGYSLSDKNIKGINWNYLIWNIKKKFISLRNDLIITVPSTWMLQRAKESIILGNKKIFLLPNPIETDKFLPLEPQIRIQKRKSFNIQDNDILVAFGAIGGQKNRLKGHSILLEALSIVRRILCAQKLTNFKLLLFGGASVESFKEFQVINLGKLHSIDAMRQMYCISDFVIVPSLVESFGQVAAESLACETPVVAFRTSGLTDIINDKTGFLAEPNDAESLARNIIQMISITPEKRKEMGRLGRLYIEEKFSPKVISKLYEDILLNACSRKITH